MNERQASIITILTTLALCLVISYFFFAYSTEEPDRTPIPTNVPQVKPQKQVTFKEMISSYEKSGDVESLLIIIREPHRAMNAPPEKLARIRALAMARLLKVPGQTAEEAYLGFLKINANKNLALVALSALNPKAATSQRLSKVKELILNTPHKSIRVKASLVYQRLQPKKTAKAGKEEMSDTKKPQVVIFFLAGIAVVGLMVWKFQPKTTPAKPQTKAKGKKALQDPKKIADELSKVSAKDPKAVAKIREALENDYPNKVKMGALSRLGQIKRADATQLLQSTWKSSTNSMVKNNALKGLIKQNTANSRRALRDIFQTAQQQTQLLILNLIGFYKHLELLEIIEMAKRHRDKEIRGLAVKIEKKLLKK